MVERKSHGDGGGAAGGKRSASSRDGASSGDGDLGLLAMDPPPAAPATKDTQRPPAASASASASASDPGPAPAIPSLTPAFRLGKRQRLLLQRWILAVGCVTFDLEKGPELEFLAPSLNLTTEEKDNIAFSSFPDTAIFDSGNAVFSWRTRTGQSAPPSTASSSNASRGVSSPPPQKTENRRFSAAASKRRQLFGSSHPASQNSTDAHSAPTSSAATSPPHSSQSVTRTQTAGLAPPPSINHRLSGVSSHGAMHALFKSSEREKDKDKDKDSGRGGHFRDFVSLLSRSNHHPKEDLSSSSSIGAGGSQTTSSLPPSPGGGEDIIISPNQTASDDYMLYPGLTASAIPAISSSLPYVYGHVFFQQRPDASIRRGYFQKSFVLISHLPLLGLWSRVVENVGQSMFRALRMDSNGAVSQDGTSATGSTNSMSECRGAWDVLRAFVNNVAQWPAPSFEDALELRVLEQSFRIDFSSLRIDLRHLEGVGPAELRSANGAAKAIAAPGHSSRTGAVNSKEGNHAVQASANNGVRLDLISPRVSLSETFKGDILADLWLLWECLLIGEPIVVLGPEPCAASTAVWHLKSLLRPLQLGVDWRPYFHLNDRDFASITPASSLSTASASASHHGNEEEPRPGNTPLALLGVSNPFFTQCPSCTDWTLLRVDGCSDAKIERPSAEVARVLVPSSSAMTAPTTGGNGAAAGGGAGGHGAGWGVGKGNKVGHSGGAAPAQYAPGLTSRRKRRVSKDRALLKQLADLSKEGRDAEASPLIRAHFVDLTRKFLAPLDGFLAKLVAQRTMGSSTTMGPSGSPGGDTSAVPTFDQQAFLSFLKASGSPLPIKSRGMNLPSLSGTSGSSGLHGSSPAAGGAGNHSHLHHAGLSSSSSPSSTSSPSSGGSSTMRASLYLDFISGPNFAPWWSAKWREVEWEGSALRLEEAVKQVERQVLASREADVKRLAEMLLLSERTLAEDTAPYTFGGEASASSASKWRHPEGEQEEGSNGLMAMGSSSRQHESEQHLSQDDDLGMGMMRQGSKLSDSSVVMPPPRSSSYSAAMSPNAAGNSTSAGPTTSSSPSPALPFSNRSDGSSSVDDAPALLGLYLSCADERSRTVLRQLVDVQRRARRALLVRPLRAP
ncbi:unnamed protein product [Tilletia controversa]|uniref:UDENN domain-containing protein n=1 Tax=Tilletia controversa TaxID=13291 RepID=A0A8X7MWU5_9BASI|nr:hypothetical protein A4X06_0g2285 [Tilletia controversa]CAD6955777.1 unnamed protein product [Tilletia controversa]CAD6975138.1 unnamed protein product [Tilletia controversa]